MLTTKGNPLVKGGSLYQTEEKMKIKMLKAVMVGGQPRKTGDIVEVNESDAIELINWRDAIAHVEETKKSARPKK